MVPIIPRLSFINPPRLLLATLARMSDIYSSGKLNLNIRMPQSLDLELKRYLAAPLVIYCVRN